MREQIDSSVSYAEIMNQELSFPVSPADVRSETQVFAKPPKRL